ncbi:arabinose efflux permease family protein [Desulfosporosinus acidiphilus SJ4]|uniref:Arabinose efflux permease family protein n=1 Tax=Desulfosporosinus acidiphilus (strain DSM 22704 / JCM 16185 / SJ4) TaxID=646529 RepID=I4D9C1_DESAJ|nr:MDR family MFS transporter [Desulfosporosinus acidiphilus]AFM42395.1 arabinose efflux permease family protein [Desulfosporosinus acidiphilus SJ4]
MQSNEQTRPREKAQTNRKVVLACIMLAMFMAAIEATIVATAIPSIVGDLGGFSKFSWVFSAFLLAQAVTIPIYGKLADLYGRKPIFSFGVIVFLIGSLLCGMAQSMNMLILFRLIQGVGAGAVQPIVTTVVGDIFDISERARIQGYLSSVWGVSSIIGPALGAFFVQYVRWSWIFWINIPIGLISMVGIWLFLKETVHTQDHKIDYLGSALIFISISALMIIFIQAGTVWPITSAPVLGLTVTVILGIFLFVLQEKRAVEPIMPLWIWKHSLILISNLATLTTGVVIIGISSFLPTYVQGVMDKTPLVAGFALAFMSMGWVVAATYSGKIMFKYGFRNVVIVGSIWALLGSLFFVTLQPAKGWLWAGAGSLLIGIGMGLARTVFIVGIQNSVDWKMRGVATASNMFMNILGNTMGAALLGGVLNLNLVNYLRSHGASRGMQLDVINLLLDPIKRGALPQSELRLLTSGLALSLHYVFWGLSIFAVLSFGLVMFFPKMVNHKNN